MYATVRFDQEVFWVKVNLPECSCTSNGAPLLSSVGIRLVAQ